MDTELTQRQREILEFITRSVEETGRPPTHREIARAFDLVYGTVQDHLAALEAKGALKRERGRARALLPALRAAVSFTGLPVLGRVPAGRPVEAVEDAQARIALDRSLAAGADYGLKVRGDSMEPEILEGDLVLVRQAAEAQEGAIVVAMVGDYGEATVKRLRRRGRSFVLEADNPRYPPIPGPFKIAGRVTGLVRRYA